MFPSISCVAAHLLDWFVPRDCLGCTTQLDGKAEWCRSCAQQLEANPIKRLDSRELLAPFRHSGPLRHAIHRLKYAARPDYAKRLIASGFALSRPELGTAAALVPVPLHPNRLVERGYNQSALLARALGRRWRLPVAFGLVFRVSATQPQVGRNRQQRASNVRGAFLVRPSPFAGQRVWLVDDVVTTGATVSSCRAALEAAGIRVGGIIAVAHATAGEADLGSLAIRHFP